MFRKYMVLFQCLNDLASRPLDTSLSVIVYRKGRLGWPRVNLVHGISPSVIIQPHDAAEALSNLKYTIELMQSTAEHLSTNEFHAWIYFLYFKYTFQIMLYRHVRTKQTSRRTNLVRRTRNEEPLVNARINRCRLQILSLGDAQLTRILNLLRTMAHRRILQRNIPRLSLPRNQSLPRLSTLLDDIHRILPILAFAAERKLVLGLAVGDLVDAEPFVGGAD